MPLSELHALMSATDCSRDGNSSPAGRWSARLRDDEDSTDSTDDDGDDAPDGLIAAAPHQIDVGAAAAVVALPALVVAHQADLDGHALRGPPEGDHSDSSQDSTDDDDDDAPDAIVNGAPIRPIDLHTTYFVHDQPLAAYASDVETHALRGPPSLACSASPDLTDDRTPQHMIDDPFFELASGDQSLRAPPH
jgi:hypothetical protein